MIGIKSIASFLPEGRIDNLEQALKFGETEEFVREKIGAVTLSYLAEGMDTSDMAVAAIEALLANTPLRKEAVDVLVVVTQNPDGSGLPHTSAVVQNKVGLSTHIAAFDVSLGCSGYVYGLAIVKGLLETAGLKNAILVTADPYSKVVDRNDRVTALLFGDAATATWIGEDPLFEIETPLFATDGTGAGHLKVDSGVLSMNGRQVFNFASLKVPAQIKQYLARHELNESDIDLYCMHQGSAAIVDALSKRFANVAERFVSDITETGNTVSSTLPLLLESRLSDLRYNTILISGFGVGLSWATTVLKRGK